MELAHMRIEPGEIKVQGQPARIYEGGDGPVLLLIHGGWGGARMSWSRVWDSLAERYHVVAPDLPGLGNREQPPRPSIHGYVAWLDVLLDQLGIDMVQCIGNSFGGSVAWSLAGRVPHRCGTLVMVNGIPMPRTPLPMLLFGRTKLGKALMQALLGHFSYHPSALKRAFVDTNHVPPELSEMLSQHGATLLPRFADLVISGDGPPKPRISPILLWGAEDRLFGTRVQDARKLHASLPGSILQLIPGVGHFPQLEAPNEFVRHLETALKLAHQ